MVSKIVQFPLICAGALVISVGITPRAEAISVYLGSLTLGETASYYDYSQDGIDFRASAFDENNTSAPRVFRSILGLGVKRGSKDSPQIDGKGLDETLRLTFERTVRLVSATFSAVGQNDDAVVTLGGNQLYTGNIPNTRWGFGKLSFATTSIGTVADFSILGKNDDYFLKKIEVESVPEPLSILGTGLALGAGALFERKRLKSQSAKAR